MLHIINIDEVYPLIVPSGYYVEGTWDLPHYSFQETNFILTWVTFRGTGAMVYLMREQYKHLEDNHPGWRQKAFDNLRISIGDNESFFTHYKMSSEGGLLYLGFLNADGIGSSRILFSKELARAFPTGYYIAFPDRSYGLVIAKDLKPEEHKDIEKDVKKMHKAATIPMSDKLFSPELFKLPDEWVTASKSELTAIMVEEINNIK